MPLLKDFAYNLPKNLIASQPARPRDSSRLLILDKKTGRLKHRHFYDLPDYIKSGDVLVINDTKVMPARLLGRRAETGGKVEVFLLKKISGKIWQCLIGGPRRKEHLPVEFSHGLKAEIIKNNHDGTSASLGAGTWLVKFNKSGLEFIKTVEKIGQTPLPPYIKRKAAAGDKKNYQTVYADDKKLGSVAAPTAGFHFTRPLMNKLKKKGASFERVTLRVGLGTFAPVKADDITKHKMHAEWIRAGKRALARIMKAKREGRRIIAVGTTSVRVLETIFKNRVSAKNFSGWTDIFIYPPYKFRAVDALITNFHLPKSTLLMLVSALAGRRKIFKAYNEAMKKKYRFFSYGDAMLII